MGKVLRLFEGGQQTLVGWENSLQYDESLISELQEPTGYNRSKEITSIPSPFARMEIVRKAFRWVTEHANSGAREDTIYHKYVSDALDVGQIFYEWEKWKDDFEIIPWKRDIDLQRLLDSPLAEHRNYGETLRLYLEQDGDMFNFGDVRGIYLLNYPAGPNPRFNIIGGTSPMTLFFTPANAQSYVGQSVKFGNDDPFDDGYRQLWERDEGYQLYWAKLMSEIPRFSSHFKDVYNYLSLAFKRAPRSVRDAIAAGDGMGSFANLQVAAGQPVEIFGTNLQCRHEDASGRMQHSDFRIKADFEPAVAPLVLPVAPDWSNRIYVNEPWNGEQQVPIEDSRPLAERTLPGDRSKYPYLTLSDFLEPVLFHIDIPQDGEAFFNGNLDSSSARMESFALPLRPLFFEYFSSESLWGTMQDGKPMFEMHRESGMVEVVLRVPVKQSYIEYRRTYMTRRLQESDGEIREFPISLGLFPNVRFSREEHADYRVLVTPTRRGVKTRGVEVHFLQCGRELSVPAEKQIVRPVGEEDVSVYPVRGHFFDAVQLRYQEASGIIVPRFREERAGSAFNFAVDFGTSNTYMAYQPDRQKGREFEIQEDDAQLVLLHPELADEFKYRIFYDFLPQEIRSGTLYNFPTRTALVRAKDTPVSLRMEPMGEAAVAFAYERRGRLSHDEVLTGLKWDSGDQSGPRIDAYIESLMLLMRNKAILNGGDIRSSHVVWTYPMSMTRKRLGEFTERWEKAFERYFGVGVDGRLHGLPESIAPYLHFRTKDVAVNDIVCVDIGGGTSDVVFVENKEIKCVTSFRFAGDDIFGSEEGNLNGIVEHFKPVFQRLLEESGQRNLLSVLEELDSSTRASVELASFFFSLSNNSQIDEQIRGALDFHERLSQDSQFKVCFLLFYMAIMYHIAQISKAKGLQMPRHVSFSGNASGMVTILSKDREVIKDVTRSIFAWVYEDEDLLDARFEVLRQDDNPKSVTSLGALNSIGKDVDYGPRQLKKLTAVLLGVDGTTFTDGDSYGDLEKDLENVIGQVVTQTKGFFDMFFKIGREIGYRDYFDITSEILDIVRGEIHDRDLATYIRNGLDSRAREQGSDHDREVEETLFFYGLKGILQKVGQELGKRAQR